MRVLVTGGAGGLGSNVVALAAARGLEVRALVRNPARAAKIEGVEWIAGDALDTRKLREAADGCAALFHMVNVNITKDWIKTTAALLEAAIEACRATGARLVFPANVWVFGRGERGKKIAEDAPYAPCSSKGLARQHKEERIRASGIRHVMVRLPEFYGPHVQTLTGPPLLAISQRKRGMWLGPADLDVEFVYMPDAARALLTIGLAERVDGEVFHYAGAAPITPREFFSIAQEVAGGGGIRVLPAALVRAIGLAYGPARAFADILHLWTDPIVLDGEKLSARFPDLAPTPYRDGIETTLAWLRAHPDAPMYW
jgi:nucleoside-diphosphate-sugar epimerase